MYDRNNLRASQLNSVFPVCLPCRCHERQDRTYMLPRYSVKFMYVNAAKSLRGRMISEIQVECDCCARTKCYNVEKFKVYLKDIKW